MAIDVNTGFDDQEYLRDIRKVVLNPIAVKVASLDKTTQDIRTEMGPMFQGVSPDIAGKAIIFHQKNGHDAPVVLDGMFREGSDLELVDGEGTSFKDVSKVHFVDSKNVQTVKGEVEVHYPFDVIVPAHQDNLSIGKTGVALVRKPKALFFTGPDVTIDQDTPEITTIGIPKIPDQMMATTPTVTVPVPISSIMLDGNIGSSTLVNGKLTINLPDGGSGGGVSSDNFKGFFASLGDIISQVSDPKDGKSFAFALDTEYGGKYYTPYFYVNGKWAELKQDPALLYSPTSSATTQGVFSIKPSDKIQIDSNGQLDLDGLSTPQLPSHFKGFFNTLDELKAAVPNPVLHQDWAYVKVPSGWMAHRADAQGTARKWNVIAPMGSFAAINRKEQPDSFAQVYGIYKNDTWDVDSKGIMSLKPIDTTTNVVISDKAGTTTGGKINTIKFQEGKTLAEVDASTLVINNPQRVIEYSSTWEREHAHEDYRGNIYFDATSRTWMGWCDPEQQGAVGAKWTRIAHADMSLEVKDLVKRVPAKAASIQPGILNDSPSWAYNGITFLDQGSDELPDEFKNKCGGYITTSVQDKDAAGVTIPQTRMQTCVADMEGGATYVRRFRSTGTPGGDTSWSPWVRTSFSKKDINAHQDDPAAHSKTIKYHKVTSISGKFTDVLAQRGGPGGSAGVGFLRGSNCDLLVDNYGYTQGTDYLEFPYTGTFRIRGELFVSGWQSTTIPVSNWTVTLIRESKTGSQTLVGQFKHGYKTANQKYAPIFFIANNVSMEEGDKIHVKIQCPESATLNTNNPNLYFVPVKSQLVVEDMNTLAGTKIGETYKKHLANLNAFGDLEVKAHFNNFTSTNSVHVYGDVVVKTPTEMKPS